MIKLHRYLNVIKLIGQVAVDYGLKHPVQKSLLDTVGAASSNGIVMSVGDLINKPRLASRAICRKHLKILEDQGLLTIRINQNDQRSRLIVLTDQGMGYFSNMNSAILGRASPKSESVGARVWRE